MADITVTPPSLDSKDIVREMAAVVLECKAATLPHLTAAELDTLARIQRAHRVGVLPSLGELEFVMGLIARFVAGARC